jgi:hypothetical protein
VPVSIMRRAVLAAGPATRRSQARASSKPPPRAGPSMAAIVGMSRFSNRWRPALKSARNLSTCAWVIVLRSTRSAPAQNEPGEDDVIISTRLGIYQRPFLPACTESHNLLSSRTFKRHSWNCCSCYLVLGSTMGADNTFSRFTEIAFFAWGRLSRSATTPGWELRGSRYVSCCADA